MREHAKAVREAGHRVVVLHLAGPRAELGRRLWAMEEELDPSLTDGIMACHVGHRRVGVRGASYPLYVGSAVAAYRGLRDGGFTPDLIHAHVYGARVPAALIAGRTGIPLVVGEHFSGVAQRSLNRVEVRKARYAYTHAARVLPVSQFLADAIRNYGVEVPFEVVPNAVDASLFFPNRTGQKKDDTRRLIFVGNLEPSSEKGFPALLAALARLDRRRSDWHLDVLGSGGEQASYEETATALGLREQLTFHGSQSKQAVAEMMRSADLWSCRAGSRRSAQPWRRPSSPDCRSSLRRSAVFPNWWTNAAVGSFRRRIPLHSPKPSTRYSTSSRRSTPTRLPRGARPLRPSGRRRPIGSDLRLGARRIRTRPQTCSESG